MTGVDKPIVLIGIDWADKEHFYSAVEPNGKPRSGSFKQTQGDIAQWVNDGKQKYPNVRLFIAIETSRGALINALMEYPEVTIYPINPAAPVFSRFGLAHSLYASNQLVGCFILLPPFYCQPKIGMARECGQKNKVS